MVNDHVMDLFAEAHAHKNGETSEPPEHLLPLVLVVSTLVLSALAIGHQRIFPELAARMLLPTTSPRRTRRATVD